MRIGILQFPGTCDDRDAAYAVDVLGHDPVPVWHEQPELGNVDAVIVPGGFSFGDYLRAGAVATFSPAMTAVSKFAADGGRVVGICNGFQVLTEAGLLPGALTRNVGLTFLQRLQHLRVEATGEVIAIPTKHGEGRYVHPDPQSLEANGQILVRYCDANGDVNDGANPNGSLANIAGVTNKAGNVAGLMPHPEHAVDPLVGYRSVDGRGLLSQLLGLDPVSV